VFNAILVKPILWPKSKIQRN